MTLSSSADRFLSMSDTAGRRPTVEDLIAEIAGGLTLTGEYMARIDLQPTQGIVDFNWAARQAGRRLGLRVHVSSQLIKTDGQVHVRVTTQASLR